ITGRRSPAAAARAAELGLEVFVEGAEDKLPAFRAVVEGQQLRTEQTAYVGDDIPDLPVLAECGLGIAVADACPEGLARAHYVTRAPGGAGAVREVVELILRNQGRWESVVERSKASERTER